MKPYGYISNQLTGVLIDDLASIVWFPVPRYDSSPIFAKILDEDYGGEFSIIVTNDEVINTTQEYEAMNILVTTLYLKSGNKVKVIDLLSIGESGLIRKIENDVPIKLIVNPTFEYALYRPIRVFYRNAIQFLNPVSDDCIALIYDEGKRYDDGSVELKPGTHYIYLVYYKNAKHGVFSKKTESLRLNAMKAFENTYKYWREKDITYHSPSQPF